MMLPLIWLFLLLPERPPQNSVVYTGNSGTIRFISDAELERIEAASDQLAGAINSETREVFFSLRVGSFVGFNGGLQQEHFYENYLETDVFPSATFKGRIVDDVDLKKNGTYAVRVKGMLTIHGISTERIIDGTITVSGAGMKVESAFPVLLDDHNITIPKIVEMKISPEVKVDLKINLTRNSS
jgi:hypothetical protein